MDVLEPLAPNPQSSLAESVYETLLEAIIAGRITSGTILSEVAVAEKLEVSRTPVHDALRQLAQDGLVERSTGRRARVSEFNADDVFEIFEMRVFLEGPAAQLAAGRMDVRQVLPLRTAIAELRESRGAADWTTRWADHDEEFHRVIATESGNKRLARDIERYRLLHRGFNKMSADEASLQNALAEHECILDLIEQRDGPNAKQAMIDHIRNWQAFFVKNFRR